jgi:hypothetical protein
VFGLEYVDGSKQPTPAQARVAEKQAIAAGAGLMLGVYGYSFLRIWQVPTAALWGAAVCAYLLLLLTVFCCMRARIMSWDSRHPFPDDDGGGGGGWRQPPTFPHGSGGADWDAFEKQFRSYAKDHEGVGVT